MLNDIIIYWCESIFHIDNILIYYKSIYSLFYKLVMADCAAV